jgi:glucose/arabinose dehydrogenase
MRKALMTGLLMATACTGSGQELAPTPPTSEPATSSSLPSTTTTTTSPATTTTTPPTTTTTLAELRSLSYEEVAGLEFPVEMTALPGSDLSYIATKDGRVWAYDGSEILEDPVLDISDQVRNDGEQGFLSIALHPDEGSRFFAHYSDNNGDTVVAEFTFTSPTEIDAGSERVLLTLDQPAGNHNGGMITVEGGILYVGLGDGGRSGDAFGNGQNTDTLFAGLVTIDLEDPDSDPVLWQYGLRNPWRFWFDEDLVYIADVGQNAFEEVNVADVAEGVNYGWPITEGLHCFSPSSECDTSGLTLPVVEVGHGDAGTCSITGGVVYRGGDIPEIDGHYFYSDYCGGYLRSFVYEGEVVEEMDWTEQVGVAGSVTGFGVDGRGEMYVTTTERLLKVVADRGE